MTTQTVAPATTKHPVAAALTQIHDEMSDIFLERRAPLEGVILAMLAKEHAFILGPPGTGKSALTRDLFDRIVGAAYFEAILSKTRPAEAVLGPYDIPKLQQGDLHRKIAGFLPTANYAMLDEVGKMSPTLGHDLLAVVLERRLHQVNGGRSWVDCPLYSFIGASNELPAEESDDAAALWDRMLVRVVVDYIEEPGNFAALIQGGNTPTTHTTVSFTDLADAVDNVVPLVVIPNDVIESVLKLRDVLRAEEINPSDRRWKQAMKLLKASAFLAGRTEATEDDLGVLRHALWDVPAHMKKVERSVMSISNPINEAALRLLDDIVGIAGEIRDRQGQSIETKAAFGTEAHGKLKMISEEVGKLRQECITAGRSTTKLDEVSDKLNSVKRSVLVDLLEMDPSAING